jgi:heme o synthase
MKRTMMRPLPAGHVTTTQATVFGATAAVSGAGLLYAATNPVVAALGAANILLYSGAYTYSKRHTEWNTWIGAVVGAIPPVMGWAAATEGQVVAAEPMLLASLLFLWQFPHFFALSYLHREDYARGNFEMVAVNDAAGARSARLITEYSLYLTALPIVASAAGITSYMFAVEGTVVNAYLLYLAGKFNKDRTNAGAKRVFLCSLWYLPVIMAAFLFHSRNWDSETVAAANALKSGEEADEVTGVVYVFVSLVFVAQNFLCMFVFNVEMFVPMFLLLYCCSLNLFVFVFVF